MVRDPQHPWSPLAGIVARFRTPLDVLGFIRPPGYLREADYYRLGYQLLATRANRLVAAGDLAGLDRALGDASRLQKQVQLVLDYFQRRRAPAWFPFWRPLDSQERRLRQFLASTVEPCVVLGIGVLNAERHGPDSAERTWKKLELEGPRETRVRPKWWLGRRPKPVEWGPRALFNLACLASMTPKQERPPLRRSPSDLCRLTGTRSNPRDKPELVVAGVWALEQALLRANGKQRAALLQAIIDDPTLAALRNHNGARADIQRLLERFAVPLAPGPSWRERWWRR